MKRVQFPKSGAGIQSGTSITTNQRYTRTNKNIQMTGHYYNPASNSTPVQKTSVNLVDKFLSTNIGYKIASAFGYKLDEDKYAFKPPQQPVKPQGPESEKYKKDLMSYKESYHKYMNLTEYPGRPKDATSRAYAEWYIKNKTFLDWKAQELHKKADENGTFDKNGYRNIASSDISSELD